MAAKAASAGLLAFLCGYLPCVVEAAQRIAYSTGYPPGAVLISPSAKMLYLVLDAESAIAYPVAVPRRGKAWSGAARIAGNALRRSADPEGPAAERRRHAVVLDRRRL